MIPGRLYAAPGGYGIYIFDNIEPGFMKPIEVYEANTPFLFLVAEQFEDKKVTTCFVKILYKEKIGYLKAKLLKNMAQDYFLEEGPDDEAYLYEKKFYAVMEKEEVLRHG